MTRPVIGISGPDRGGFAAWFFAALGVRLQGGRPKRLRPSRHCGIAQLDGLIIGGGADIEPDEKSGEVKKISQAVQQNRRFTWGRWLLYPVIFMVRRLFSIKKPQRYDADRDQLETGLIKDALAQGLPLLGICRGAQLINYVLDGTLHQDIHEFYEESPLPRSIFPVKNVRIESGSLLENILGLSSCRVNALHHQSIDQLGTNIEVSGREDNGLIQAIESNSHRFLVGVQWHPEYLPLEHSQRRLFRALVESATERRGNNSKKSAP